MSGASFGPENDPQLPKNRVPPDGLLARGEAFNSTNADNQSALVPPTVVRHDEIRAALLAPAPLEPWRQQLAVLRTSLFFAGAVPLLERVGNLILFPTELEAFKDGQRECIERYIAFRNKFGSIFKQLIQVYSRTANHLPVKLGGLNTAAVEADRLYRNFEHLVIGRLKALKELSVDAVGLHKAAFDGSVRTDSRGKVGVDRIPDEGDVVSPSELDYDEQREFFADLDSELRAVLNQCELLSHYIDNRDEALSACRVADFVQDKGRELALEGQVDSTAVIVTKIQGLAVVLEQSTHLLALARNRALDVVRLERADDVPLTQTQLVELQKALEAPFTLTIDEESYSDGGERRKKIVLEVGLALGDSMRSEYANAYNELEAYFDALKSYAREQGIGVVVHQKGPRIDLYVDAADEKTCGSLTTMGPYPGQDSNEVLSDEEEDQNDYITDPRAVHDCILSVSPNHKRGIFIECAQAALASEKALSNFQAVRKLIHTWADLEVDFKMAALKAFSPKGNEEGAGLLRQWEKNGFTLALTSTAELNPNFRLENEDHPLSRALPCDEELEAEARGWASHTWGPILTEDRTRRLLLVEAGAFGDPKVLKPVENILRHAHPLFLSVAVRQAGKAKQDQGYREVAQELRKLADQLEQIKNELGGKRLYVAQLDILSEQAYPGFKNVVAVYNIYDSHGVLVSRVNVERQGTSPADVTLVPRTLDGRDLKRAEKEVLTVLESCGAGLRHTHTDVRNHFADRNIHLCDTVVQAICWAAEPDSNEGPEEAIAKIFRGPSVWIERELDPEGGTRLYVFSQREREYS